MSGQQQPWALVLAAGDGSRLRSLTTLAGGVSVPKQFCGLHGGVSLLDDALWRARAVSSPARVAVVVAEQHQRWWKPALARLAPANIVVQPANRGTALGILLPLLYIVERDPHARILILPSDHYVREEAVLAHSLQRALEQLQWRFGESVLLGFEPDECDAQLGYIVPGPDDGRGALQVQRFIEKPDESAAQALIEAGALWNGFIIASSASALLGLYRSQVPAIVRELRAAVQEDRQSGTGRPIARLYEQLPTIDFSAHILSGNEASLRVLPVPRCGWSDLGTPERLAKVLQHGALSDGRPAAGAGAPLILADRHASRRDSCG